MTELRRCSPTEIATRSRALPKRDQQKAGLDLRAAALLAGAAVPVTFVCALVATSLASRPLRIAFAIFLIAIALDIGRRALRTAQPTTKLVLPWPFVGLVGAFCGMFSGFFGMRYGVDLAHRLPERTLRLVFVAFTIAVGIALLIKAFA